MKRLYLYIKLFAAVLMISGCGSTGLIYSHVTSPLDTNMSATLVGTRGKEAEIKHIAVNGCIMFMWDSAAIADIARWNGIETVYYADLEELHILGLCNTYTVHIYGQ